jgi:hypothetical protein
VLAVLIEAHTTLVTFYSLPHSITTMIGQLIGYYYKSQPTPKPIYKLNRVVLGKNPFDETYANFINANEAR